MRLLNASTKSVKGFVDSILQYTVLSHTWDTDEITYQDILAPGGTVNKAGWAKVHGVCEKAKEHGYEYIWIDTCCIDKSSSAELSEAINSMLKWYRYAEVCYAYLSDMVPAKGGTVLSNGRWFTRGWTLQELIAPERMGFYNADWNYIGEKESFADQISTITGIPKTILVDAYSLWSTSIACRMSWAAKRKTTRVEDMAYYLVGLFGVNMPLLYGEGEKAFLRLQEEIIKISDDQSILAWDLDTNPYRVSVLAQTPFDFLNSSNIIPIPRNPDHGPFTMTHMGLSIRLPM
ncbi:HET-domain-containing protein, partial [Eremomyces bilateralis CBS 781.70]